MTGPEQEALDALHRFLAAEEDNDFATTASMLSDRHSGYGTGIDEVARSYEEALRLISRMTEQSTHLRKRSFELLLVQEVTPDLVIVMADIVLDILLQSDQLTMDMRTSYIWERTAAGWKLLHQHVSEASDQQEPGDSFPMQRVYERNQELEALVQERTTELRRAMCELQNAANTDRLTGLPNRTHLDEILREEFDSLQQGDRQSVLAILDVDHFKEINDRYGHLTGDTVLRQVASQLRSSLRSTDHLGRWGGEEFLMVLPLADAASLAAVAERIRSELRTADFGIERPITVSGGFAWYRAGESLDSWLSRADSLLYEAKRGGRDRFSFDS